MSCKSDACLIFQYKIPNIPNAPTSNSTTRRTATTTPTTTPAIDESVGSSALLSPVFIDALAEELVDSTDPVGALVDESSISLIKIVDVGLTECTDVLPCSVDSVSLREGCSFVFDAKLLRPDTGSPEADIDSTLMFSEDPARVPVDMIVMTVGLCLVVEWVTDKGGVKETVELTGVSTS